MSRLQHMMKRAIAYVTDVEGNLEHLDKVVQLSPVLQWESVPEQQRPHHSFPRRLAFQDDSGVLVFGGDAVDKGKDDAVVVNLLCDVKDRFPDRVFLLIGNRDMNKMRYSAELSHHDVHEREVEELPGVYWVPEDERVTPAQFLRENQLSNTTTNRLKWMLQHTMGCQTTFALRKQFLAGVMQSDEISEEEVTQSFVESVGPDGYMRSEREDNARQWIDKLNEFAREGVEEWERDPLWNADRTYRGGQRLMDYGVAQKREGGVNPTVVYETFLDDGVGKPPQIPVVEWLESNNIRRIVTGHAPQGDYPATFTRDRGKRIAVERRSDATLPDVPLQFQVVACDTSYSNYTKRPELSVLDSGGGVSLEADDEEESEEALAMRGSGARGHAAAAVTIYDDEERNCSQVRINGVCGRQEVVSTALRPLPFDPDKAVMVESDEECGDPFVGRETVSGWWVRGQMQGAASSPAPYYIARSEGWTTRGAAISAESLARVEFKQH